MLTGCTGMGKPVSTSSMPGRYVLSAETLEASAKARAEKTGDEVNDSLSALAGLDLSVLELDLEEDGTGSLVIHSDTETVKRLSWRLDGGSKNPEILLTLTEALSAKDTWTMFLLTLESDPSHTKISGKVTEDGITIKQRDTEKSMGITLVFVKEGEE